MPTPRKPTATLKLEGTYQPAWHGDRSGEPQPKGEPVMPKGLPREVQDYWRRVVPQLVETGVATAIDTDALVRMAIWFVEGEKLLRVKKRDPKWIYRFQAADKNLRDYMARFGLTPVDRTRIDVRKEESSDPAASFIA